LLWLDFAFYEHPESSSLRGTPFLWDRLLVNVQRDPAVRMPEQLPGCSA
jgi:hypothetical protein